MRRARATSSGGGARAPAPSSKAEIFRCASCGMISSSLSQGLLVRHCPKLGALNPVPYGGCTGPCGGPARPFTYGWGHAMLSHWTCEARRRGRGRLGGGWRAGGKRADEGPSGRVTAERGGGS